MDVRLVSFDCAFYCSQKKTMAVSTELKKIEILPFSMFFPHGYLQHNKTMCRGRHSLRCHAYFVTQKYKLFDTIAFVYGADILENTKSSIPDSSADRSGTSIVDKEEGRG